ncbi:unnamed protein product [Rotaria magnacalcarata]|uniref:Uncharacterized protein n=1 Tax=Rotaria magnacalcarata TaxID=392030 RepID=A0A819TN16_9BILA|nr:unnamed protein product [Rotaria magnacalcarata]CAF4080971.1 unnamed protein product [Rotaria magnacalcarata]
MFNFQTLSCLGGIPVIQSSTRAIYGVYTDAKNKSLFIRFPCNLVETIANKSSKIVSNFANSLVEPLRRPVYAIDDFTAEKIRQIESKYTVMKTRSEEVMVALSKKAEHAHHVLNCAKQTTTSTIQHGKQMVAIVASVTVNKVTNVADTVYTFCENHVPGKTTHIPRDDFCRRTTLLWNRLTSSLDLKIDYVVQSIFFFLKCYQNLIVSLLLKTKLKHDNFINNIKQRAVLFILFKRLFIFTGAILDYVIEHIETHDKRETKEQSQLIQQRQQQKQFVCRQTLKPNEFLFPRQTVGISKQDSVTNRSKSEEPEVNVEEKINPTLNFNNIHQPKSPSIEFGPNDDTDKLHDRLEPIDIEFLFSKLPFDNISCREDQESSTDDDEIIHTQFE